MPELDHPIPRVCARRCKNRLQRTPQLSSRAHARVARPMHHDERRCDLMADKCAHEQCYCGTGDGE